MFRVGVRIYVRFGHCFGDCCFWGVWPALFFLRGCVVAHCMIFFSDVCISMVSLMVVFHSIHELVWMVSFLFSFMDDVIMMQFGCNLFSR